MYFVSLNQKTFLEKLNLANQVSPKKSEIDLFTYTKFEIKGQELKLSAINPSLFYSANLQLETTNADGNIEFLIKTDILASSVALIVEEKIGLEIDLEKHTLIVQGNKAKHTLRIDTHNIADFRLPDLNQEPKNISLRILSADLVAGNKAAYISVGQAKTVYQPEFLNICYGVSPESNQLTIVSTDRYRITKTVFTVNYTEVSSDASSHSTNFLVQPKNLQLLDTCASQTESVELVFGANYLWAIIENSTLIMRYGDGKYPDYNKIIPQSFTCTFSVNTKDTITALRQVYLFAKTNVVNRSITLKVEPSKNQLQLLAQTSDGFSSESTIDMINYEGVQDDWTQAFNAEYLLDYISSVNKDNIYWEANPGKPSVLSPENQKERQLYLVSGLR